MLMTIRFWMNQSLRVGDLAISTLYEDLVLLVQQGYPGLLNIRIYNPISSSGLGHGLRATLHDTPGLLHGGGLGQATFISHT